MKNDAINQEKKLYLSYDLLEYYDEFKDEILYQLDDEASIIMEGIKGNPYYVLYKYDDNDMCFSIYPINERSQYQVMKICWWKSVADYNNSIKN
jgi:hypothetical protein